MYLFHGRPLAAIAAAAALLSAAGVAFNSIVPFAAAAALCALSVTVALVTFHRRRIVRYRAATVCAAAVIVALFCVRASAFFVFSKNASLALCGENREVCGVVRDRVYTSNFAVSYDVRLCFVDRQECSADARLECSFSCPMQNGDLFLIRGADVEDSALSSASLARNGIYITVSCRDRDSLTITGNGGGSRTSLASRLSYMIRNRIGSVEGGLCAAMLLGDRSYLDESVSLSFRRAGISHLLAVSGLHMTMLTGMLSAVLQRIRIRRSLRCVILAAFAVGYAALLGFPVSATRSAVMLVITYICLLSGFESDGVSALGFAVCVILFARPGAVADVGFILSVCGTLGLLTVMREYHPERAAKKADEEAAPRRLLRSAGAKLGQAVFAAVSANMLTVLPVALSFGELSKASIPCNLVFPPLAGAVLILTLLTIVAWPLPFVSKMAAFYAKKVASVLIRGADGISGIDGVTVSLRLPLTLSLLIAATLLTAVFLTVKLKRKYITVLPFLAAMALIICCDGVQYPGSIGCVSLSVGNGEAFCAAGGGKAVIIDMSAGNYAPLSSAASAAESLGATETAALVLTHYHVRHVGTVSRFVSEHKVRGLYIPEPQTKKDASVALSVIDAASQCGIPVYEYTSFENIDVFGGITLSLSGPLRIDRSTHPVLSFILERGNERIIWFGRSSWESFEILSYLRIDDGTTLIAGRHGPVIKSPCDFDLKNAGRITVYSRDQLYELTAGAVPASELFDISSTDVGVYPSGVFVEIGG